MIILATTTPPIQQSYRGRVQLGDGACLAAVVLHVLPCTKLPMNTCRKAQRVIGCAAPRSG